MKKCLIVVDYQNDFVNGVLGFAEAALLEKPIAEKIRSYRKNNDQIIFTYDTHDEDYFNTLEGKLLPIAHCVRGTRGHELFGEAGKLIDKSDLKFFKNTFGSDLLYEHLKRQAYKSIELAGVMTNVCVITNAVLAKTAQPQTPVIVDSKCVASNDIELNDAALRIMESLQITILNK